MDDGKIVDLFLLRNELALEYTKAKYGKKLVFLSDSIVKDKQTAEECENDTYLKAWDSIPPNEPREHLFAYLARIIRNISLNRCRDTKRLKRDALICELSEELENCIPSPDDVENCIDDISLGNAINGFLEKLDSEKRKVFIRRYWYLDSVSEISSLFGMSESKVKSTLFRCRNSLREHLESEGHTL